jgi:hypothetical protein
MLLLLVNLGNVADPGSGAFLASGSGSGSGIRWKIIQIQDPGSVILLSLDPGSGMEKIGSGINIPDLHH